MKILARLLLLLFCGVLGVAVAVFVAFTLHDPSSTPLAPVAVEATVERQPAQDEPALADSVEVLNQPVPSDERHRLPVEEMALAEPPLPGSGEAVAASAPPPEQERIEDQLSRLTSRVDTLPSAGLATTPVDPDVPASVLLRVLEKFVEVQQAAAVPAAALAGTREPGAESVPLNLASSVSQRDEPAEPSPAVASQAEPIPPGDAVTAALPASQQISAEGDDSLSINIEDADIREVLDMLAEQGELNILSSASVQGKVTARLKGVSVDDALAAILRSTGYLSRREGKFIYVGTAQDFEAARATQEQLQTRLYRPNYVTAGELEKLLTPMLTPGVGRISVTSPAGVGIATDGDSAGGDSLGASDAVLLQDYESVLHEIDQVMVEIDKRPAQVSIEAIILSVTLDDAHAFGIDLRVLRDREDVRLGFGTPRTAALQGAGVDDGQGGIAGEFDFTTGGLRFAFMNDDLGVFIDALETIGDTNVIARPRLLCLNKQRAEILIGQQLGYLSTTQTETVVTQNVEFLEVGAQLRLRPYISNDGLIRLEVHPELSTGQVVTTGAFTLPEKTLTQVTTNVMCPDGCTVIIGGLMRENLQSDVSQVPLLGSMPLVGPLFRHREDQIRREEILVLITPRIVYDREHVPESTAMADEWMHRHNVRLDAMSPTARVQLAVKHLEIAQQAWANREFAKARRHARLACHYDPENFDAIAFRDMLLGASSSVEVSTLPPPGVGPEVLLDGEQLPAWMIDELQLAPEPRQLHPIDAGVPGPSVDIEPAEQQP